MIGTLINAGTVIVGSAIGMMIKSRLPEKIINIVFQGIGLFTIVIGVSMSLASNNLLIAVVSIVLGAVIGQLIDIDKYLQRFSLYLQSKNAQKNKNEKDSRFTEGFITATMLFCVGSMSILGPIEDGMGQTPTILYTKSIMDGISSIALASSFGIAIMFSSLPLLVYQGLITIFATFMAQFMSTGIINDLTCVGGILLIGLGINILDIKKISVINILPALVVVVILSYFFN